MFLVDDDELESMVGQEKGRTGAEDDIAFARPDGFRYIPAADGRFSGMEYGKSISEMGVKPFLQLTAQGDLGHEIKYIPAFRDRFHGGLYVNFSLSRTCDSVQQDRLFLLETVLYILVGPLLGWTENDLHGTSLLRVGGCRISPLFSFQQGFDCSFQFLLYPYGFFYVLCLGLSAVTAAGNEFLLTSQPVLDSGDFLTHGVQKFLPSGSSPGDRCSMGFFKIDLPQRVGCLVHLSYRTQIVVSHPAPQFYLLRVYAFKSVFY